MSWNGFLSWYYQYFPFIWQNEIYHVIAALLIVTIIHPFLNLEYKNRKNYVLYLMIPVLFGSVSPDFIFLVYTVIKNKGFNMLQLESGGWLYNIVHGWGVFLVIPVTFVLVGLVVVLLELIIKRKSFKFKAIILPRFWWIWVLILSLFGAILHIIMDTVGF